MNFSQKILVLAFFICCPLITWGHDGGKGINDSAPANIGATGPFSSRNVTLLSHMNLGQIGGGPTNVLGNDCWGWTDPLTSREYAIFGLTNGTSFIDITDPTAPIYLGKLNSQTGNTAWRDMKVYNNHAFIVSDANGAHGMQVFDLTQLRTVAPNNPQSFTNTAHYTGINSAHNIAINEATGFAYIVGSNQASGGLHIVNIQNPTNPVAAGNFSADGYTHDTQVVNYGGPDTSYLNREIAFSSNEDTLTIVDVTNKSNLQMISRAVYSGSEYAHQGWLSEDHKYFFMDDELDERRSSTLINTRTRVWNVEDLDNPQYLGFINGAESTIDHNLYVKGNLIFQANYTSGLRVLRINDAQTLDMEEIAFLDTYGADNNVTFNGAWSVYPYFDSGTVIVSDRQNGLFMVRLNSVPEPGSLAMISALGLLASTFRRRRTV